MFLKQTERYLNNLSDQEGTQILYDYYREKLGLTEFQISHLLNKETTEEELHSFYEFVFNKHILKIKS